MSIEDIEQDAQSDPEPQGGSDESYDSGDVGDSTFVVSEKRKPISKSTLMMFVIILCAKAGMYFMYKRSVPSKAEAADPKATQVIKQFMSDKEKNFSLMQKMIKDTEAVMNQFLNYPSLKQIPLSELQSNPFKMAGGKQEEDADAKADARRKKEEAERIEAEKKAVEKAVNDLNLQSVVTSGARKACMVNNTLYTQGQNIVSGDVTFTIETIAPNKVIVRSGVYGFELTMRK